MAIYLIIVSTQTPEQCDEGPDARSELARWEASFGGTRWIQQLVLQGKAKQLLFAGHPERFIAAAGDVLPLIALGPPHEGQLRQQGNMTTRQEWSEPATIDQAKFDSCPADQMLTIDAWDQ